MSGHVAVTAERHANLRINTQRSAALGDAVMSCVTFPAEFRSLQPHYPIVFQLNPEREEFRAVALFGFERGENLFLDGTGWAARYIPLAMDVQPFLVGLSRDPNGANQVHIDMNSARVGETDGVRIFNEQGKPTDFLESVSEKLGVLHENYQRTGEYIKLLLKHDLLEPFVAEIGLNDQSKHRLIGFHTINEEKLFALDGAALAEFQTSWFLLPTFMAVASQSNFVKLIDRKNALLANAR